MGKKWGGGFQHREQPWCQADLFAFRLDEQDASGQPTRDRELTTTGLRLLKHPRGNEFDYEVESDWQFGRSRLSTKSTIDLRHFAYLQHVQLGYTFGGSWAPRLMFQYDYASGDSNSTDNRNGRFDTLFGARRFELGPTGIFGAFSRANISSPGW